WFVFRPVARLRHQLDRLERGEYQTPETSPTASDEFSIMAAKGSLLGERLRGAEYEMSELPGALDHGLQDLEDWVLNFNQTQRGGRVWLVSSAVENFLGQERLQLTGKTAADIFPTATALGSLIEEAVEAGRPIRSRRVVIEPGELNDGTLSVVLLTVEIFAGLQ